MPGVVWSRACGRLGELQRIINLQLEGFCLLTSGCCPEVEWVAAAVQTKVPESQNVVAEMRESGKHDHEWR